MSLLEKNSAVARFSDLKAVRFPEEKTGKVYKFSDSVDTAISGLLTTTITAMIGGGDTSAKGNLSNPLSADDYEILKEMCKDVSEGKTVYLDSLGTLWTPEATVYDTENNNYAIFTMMPVYRLVHPYWLRISVMTNGYGTNSSAISLVVELLATDS